jgi:hypothetical protein
LRIDGNDIQHDFFEIVDEETKTTGGWQERLWRCESATKLKADESLLMEVSRQKNAAG